MPGNYSKMEKSTAAVLARKAAGESNQQISEIYGLSRRQIKQLVNRQNRKRRKLEAGITIRPKGRPRKSAQTPEAEQEIRQLRMTVELLRNFLSEAGRW